MPYSTTSKDLGVIINSNLTPSSHIGCITVTANQGVNLIYRSFISRDLHLLVCVFTTYVPPVLESHNSVTWSPYYKCDIECIENLRRCNTILNGYQALKSYIWSAFKTCKSAQSRTVEVAL